MQIGDQTKAGYRQEIDGLRAIAVSLVILFHAGYSTISGGYVGVDVFFVISGFLITQIIDRELTEGRFSIRTFYQRRARRILPALIVVLITSLVCAVAWLMPYDIQYFAKSLLASIFFTANIFFWRTVNYFTPEADELPLLHLWSLGVEEQFYIGFPILMLVLARISRRFTFPILFALLLASLGLSEVLSRINSAPNFYLLPTRAWELLSGACLALAMPYLSSVPRRLAEVGALVGLGLILGSAILLNSGTPTPSLMTLPAVLGAVFVLAWSRPDNLCGKLLAFGPLRFLGLISYSAYLWHQPVIAFAQVQPFGDLGVMFKPVTVALSFLLAAASWKFVEEPFRHGSLSRHPFKIGGVGLAAVAAITCVVLLCLKLAPTRFPAYVAGVRLSGAEIVSYAERENVSRPCREDLAHNSEVESCHFGVVGKPPQLILWGDSYARALLHGMDVVAKRRGLSGVAYVKQGCPPILNMDISNRHFCTPSNVDDIFKNVANTPGRLPVFYFGDISGLMFDDYVFIDNQRPTPAVIASNIGRIREALHRSGKRLVFIEQGPRFPVRAAEYVLAQARRGVRDSVALPRVSHEEKLSVLRDVPARTDLYIRTTDFFCDKTKCPAQDDRGHLIIYDRDHLSRMYAEELAEAIISLERAGASGLSSVRHGFKDTASAGSN